MKNYSEIKNELETIVKAIENENIAIDELLPLLQKAEALVKACEAQLRNLKIN